MKLQVYSEGYTWVTLCREHYTLRRRQNEDVHLIDLGEAVKAELIDLGEVMPGDEVECHDCRVMRRQQAAKAERAVKAS